MQIESFLAARRECGEGGFYLWAGIIRMDGVILWSAADCIGAGASHSVAEAQYVGAVAILKKLGELRKQHPAASLALFAGRGLCEELKGEWAQSPRSGPSAHLDEARDLLRSLWPLTLASCSETALMAAHELITELCERNGVRVEKDRALNASERKRV